MKKLVWIAGCVIVIVVAGFAYWAHITSPKYSLLKARDAFAEHDATSFEKYVDIEGVFTDMMDQFLGELEHSGDPGEEIGRGLFELLKPQFGNVVRRQVIKLVETGDFEQVNEEEGGAPVSFFSMWEDVAEGDSQIEGIRYVKKEGKIAYVGLGFQFADYDTSLILDVKMRDRGRYWQVASLSNFQDFTEAAAALEQARISTLNAPIVEEIERCLQVRSISKSEESDSWGFDKHFVLILECENVGQRVIQEYLARVTIRRSDGSEIKRVLLQDTDPIEPGASGGGRWKLEVNMFDSADEEVHDTPASALDLEVSVTHLELEDGTEFTLHDSGEGPRLR